MNVSNLLKLLIFHSFQFNSDFFSDLNILPLGNILIMKYINIAYSLKFKVSIELMAPFCKEFVLGF